LSPRRVEAPPPLDVEAILRAFDRHGVDYVLIGGIAAVLHGSPMATWGVDLTPAPSRENLRRLASALRELEVPLDDRSLASDEILKMTTSAGWLGLYRQPAGEQSYETLAPNAESYDVFGLSVRVSSPDDVIHSKLALARNSDLRSVPLLCELQRRRG
jgi:hypothetical protein